MDKKLFPKLVESMQQMNEIARGERAPSREFHVEPTALGVSENTPIRIASVRPNGDFALSVTFTNGKTFSVDLRAPVFRLKALRPLRDERFFARAKPGEGGFSLVWPGELDMGADRIYETAIEQAKSTTSRERS